MRNSVGHVEPFRAQSNTTHLAISKRKAKTDLPLNAARRRQTVFE